MISKRFVFILMLTLIPACVAYSAVPPVISYQGKLLQPSGAPVPDGTYSIQFAIYDVPTGGNSLWSETNPSVQVKGGLFSVLLGSVVNLPANIFDNPDRWFAVKVGDDSEMTPRQKIASVVYAIKAEMAASAATVADASITTDKIAAGAVTVDKLAVGVAVPSGTIVMWSGATTSIPQGWALCDGTNGTPDLRNRFIVGAGDEYAVAAIGGEKFHQLSVAEMPKHSHFLAWEGLWAFGAATDQLGGSGRWAYHKPDQNTGDTGGDQPHENRPPYYALCFIMKLGY